MTTRINPPSLEKAKTYERFKQEVLAWREITDLAKNKQVLQWRCHFRKMMNTRSRIRYLIKFLSMFKGLLWPEHFDCISR